jgi:acyl-CoA synthetase (AMP-forming)/AMP-acid ligase II
VLCACPGVADACVVGLPDDRWGAVVAALVVASEPDAEALLAAAAPRLARFELPRRIAFVDAIPRTPNGKPDRAAARARLTAAANRDTPAP